MAHTEIVTRTNIIDAFRPVIMHYYFAMGRMDLSVFRELFTVTCIFRSYARSGFDLSDLL